MKNGFDMLHSCCIMNIYMLWVILATIEHFEKWKRCGPTWNHNRWASHSVSIFVQDSQNGCGNAHRVTCNMLEQEDQTDATDVEFAKPS